MSHPVYKSMYTQHLKIKQNIQKKKKKKNLIKTLKNQYLFDFCCVNDPTVRNINLMKACLYLNSFKK